VTGQIEYRLVAAVRGIDPITTPWTKDRDQVVRDLGVIQDAQATGDPVRLPWLAVKDGGDVIVARIEERTPFNLGDLDTSGSFFTRDMKL
jgi:hypothetical protein